MEELNLIDRFIQEATNMDVKNFIVVALIFYIPFYFSKKAESTFFHLLYSLFGIYMIATMQDARIIYDTKMLMGLGLLLPQIPFIIRFTKNTIRTIKMMTANTYYFFVTIYYKILRFFNWIKSRFIMFKVFFTTFSLKKEDYREQEENSYSDYNYDDTQHNFYEEPKHEEQKGYEKQESKSKSNYEEPNNSYQKEKSYKYEEPKKEYKQKKQSRSKQENHTKKEEPKKNEPKKKQIHTKFKQFYSESAYTVLGVKSDDDYKTIKKAYRKLVREYHPDLNPDNEVFYNEITQKINGAWEKVESWKK